MATRRHRHFDIIVVGVGAMGSACCRHLARRKLRVLGLDQYAIPNALGSSHGGSRAIRLAYYEHPDYVPLLRRAYALWRDLEAESGEKLLEVTGGLYLGPADSELVRGSLDSARQHGLEHELLDREGIARRFPQFHVPAGHAAVFESQAGFLRPELAISVHAALALRHGAELHGHEPVIRWEATTAGVTVETPRASYQAEQAIFCGGPWTGKLLADLPAKLVVTRQVMGWVWPRRPERFERGRFPVWALQQEDGIVYYGFPLLPDAPGLKVARHRPGPACDPDTLSRHPAPGDEEEFRPALARYLPDADGPLLSLRVCLYTNTPDSHFILDRHPRHERVLVACGFSGHGFKFAPAIGEALADLAQQGSTSLPIGFLGLSRFGAMAPGD